MMFKPKDWLDRAFEVGIILKGLNGLAELVGGLLLLFATPVKPPMSGCGADSG